MVHVIVTENRRAIVTSSNVIGCEGEANASIVRWKMPRRIDGIDLSACRMQVNYINAEGTGDVAEVVNPEITKHLMMLDWRVSALARVKAGTVTAGLELSGQDENGNLIEFRTDAASFAVREPHPDEDPSGPSLVDSEEIIVLAVEEKEGADGD